MLHCDGIIQDPAIKLSWSDYSSLVVLAVSATSLARGSPCEYLKNRAACKYKMSGDLDSTHMFSQLFGNTGKKYGLELFVTDLYNS